jgi:hypothetical protein
MAPPFARVHRTPGRAGAGFRPQSLALCGGGSCCLTAAPVDLGMSSLRDYGRVKAAFFKVMQDFHEAVTEA